MQALIIALLCVINLVLWLIFFLKFKKLFSTDDVIQKTREQYELLLNDVNRNALSNIDLIQMKIDELQSLIDIADRRLTTLNNEEQFISQKINFSAEPKNEKTYSRRNTKSSAVASEIIEQNQAFELDFDLKKVKRKATAQNSGLEKPQVRKRNLKTRNSQDDSKSFDKQNIQPDMPKIYMSANPIQTQKSFQEEVKKLYDAGFTVDYIAHELNKSITEVELIVEML